MGGECRKKTILNKISMGEIVRNGAAKQRRLN